MDAERIFEEYKDFLNEVNDWPEINGQKFAPADILRNLDPTAFRVGFFDYLDSEDIDVDDLDGFEFLDLA